MVAVSPFWAGCSPDRNQARTGRQVVELAPTQEPGSRSPPLTWECDRILGTRSHRTPSHLPCRVGDYFPHI